MSEGVEGLEFGLPRVLSEGKLKPVVFRIDFDLPQMPLALP